MRFKLIIALGLLLILLLSGCAHSSDFDRQLQSIVKPYSFSLAGWEARSIAGEIKQQFSFRTGEKNSNSQTVVDYFTLTERVKALKSDILSAETGARTADVSLLSDELALAEAQIKVMTPWVEGVLARQVTEVLGEQGIYSPVTWSWLKVHFPPVNFRLEKPPNILIISPRDKIDTLKQVILEQDMTTAEMESAETQIDRLDVSSLVVELGGMGAFPAFVANDAGLRYTIDTVIEEWLHQYLFFKPLGFRYTVDIAGISHNYEINTLNETVAGIFSSEMGAMVYNRYYAAFFPEPDEDDDDNGDTPGDVFDFNAAMREIRRTVDSYLAQGEVLTAEDYMEQQRLVLTEHGYCIRKLNQAYFAFYGYYAASPMSIDPIGTEMRQLRNQSASLKDYLKTAADLTSRAELQTLVNRK
jgi:hypothetical protein